MILKRVNLKTKRVFHVFSYGIFRVERVKNNLIIIYRYFYFHTVGGLTLMYVKKDIFGQQVMWSVRMDFASPSWRDLVSSLRLP